MLKDGDYPLKYLIKSTITHTTANAISGERTVNQLTFTPSNFSIKRVQNTSNI